MCAQAIMTFLYNAKATAKVQSAKKQKKNELNTQSVRLQSQSAVAKRCQGKAVKTSFLIYASLHHIAKH